ncbi:MAG: tRNA-dihydrouridine synthase family protein [Desulfovibrionaceae bacterium]|jgi:tRNA-dihydrouridine synthase B|nr:tRNA-dihydrouridine synthase family protein [Desulfovibrionaceae bacterium]
MHSDSSSAASGTPVASAPPPGLQFRPGAPWLAPLAGYSDLPFRLLCRAQGAAVCCTEMISAKGLIYDSPGTGPLLRTAPGDAPLVAQLFGPAPEILERGLALLLERCGEQAFAGFDLNAGCSVPKVVKTGSGAALLKDVDNLVAVARAMVRALDRAAPAPVGVKFRLGWQAGQEVWLDLGRRLADAGVAWLTLHPRTARQGFSGVADWTALARLKRAVAIPVLASGDLFTAEDAVRCVRETGVDGVLFARGALRNPAIFSEFKHLLATGSPPPPRSSAALLEMVRAHLRLSEEHDGRHAALLKMRTVIPRYVKDMPGAGALRKAMTSCTSYMECERLVVEHLEGG